MVPRFLAWGALKIIVDLSSNSTVYPMDMPYKQ